MCLAWLQSFSKLRQNITLYETLNMPSPAHWSTPENTKFATILVLTNSCCLDFQDNQSRKICKMFLVKNQFIMLKIFETIYISINPTEPFMSQSFIACSAMLCPFMPNDRSLWVSSLIPSIPPQKLLRRLKLALYTRHKVHISCFRIETYLLRRHTPKGHILLYT